MTLPYALPGIALGYLISGAGRESLFWWALGTAVVAALGIGTLSKNSEIKEDTSNILLESAYFNPTAIRLTSKRLGLHTESSHRFERGADIEILVRALERAASLIAELAGGTVAQGVIDVLDDDPDLLQPVDIGGKDLD